MHFLKSQTQTDPRPRVCLACDHAKMHPSPRALVSGEWGAAVASRPAFPPPFLPLNVKPSAPSSPSLSRISRKNCHSLSLVFKTSVCLGWIGFWNNSSNSLVCWFAGFLLWPNGNWGQACGRSGTWCEFMRNNSCCPSSQGTFCYAFICLLWNFQCYLILCALKCSNILMNLISVHLQVLVL